MTFVCLLGVDYELEYELRDHCRWVLSKVPRNFRYSINMLGLVSLLEGARVHGWPQGSL